MTFELPFLPGIAVVFLLMFARIGTMMMLMPALGETSIPPQVRLVLALMLTLVFYPLSGRLYPVTAATPLQEIGVLLAGELAIGFFIGLGGRMIVYALTIAGVAVANQMGLAFAVSPDPANSGQQGALVGTFLGILGVTLVFATDTHYLVLAAMNDSFEIFPPGGWLPVGDIARLGTELVADIFAIGIQISAPFLVIGIVFYFGLGLLNKLMPQMQIFFIAMPLNIVLGLGLLFALIITVMAWYLSHFESALGRFISG